MMHLNLFVTRQMVMFVQVMKSPQEKYLSFLKNEAGAKSKFELGERLDFTVRVVWQGCASPKVP